MKRLIIFLLLDIFVGSMAMAQIATDSTKVYFRSGHSRFEPEMGGNSVAMRHFLEDIRSQAAIDNIERVLVRSYTSPDGVSTANELLSENRSMSLASYIAAETGVDVRLIDRSPGGIAWDELRRMVADDDSVPLRNEVLSIIDNTPVWVYGAGHKIIGSRKKSLMELQGGDVYRWLRHHFFPELHNAEVFLYVRDESLSGKNLVATGLTVKSEPEISDEVPDIVVVTTADTDPEPEADPEPMDEIPYIVGWEIVRDVEFRRFALKANLLYAAIKMPALELEWRVSKNWSVNLEGDVAWWKQKEAHKCYQLAIVSPEVRRIWLRGSRLQHNMYAGLFVGAGLYDLEDGSKGYRGEGVMAGVSFGYSWSLSDVFSIEAGIGAGWMTAQYKEYIPYEDHHIYMRTSNTSYFGPLKLKLAIVWRFGGLVHDEERGGRI